MRTVVFDLDGTLADTSADLIAAANAVLSGLERAEMLDPDNDRAVAFRGARAMLRKGLTRGGNGAIDAEVERLFPDVLSAYSAALHVETVLYPGARAAVKALRDSGYATAICTNKPEGLAKRLIASLEIADLFDALIGADTLPVRKPDPLPLRESILRAGGVPEQAVLVGDTETDRETARAASIPCVLVAFGPEGDDVASLGPNALLQHFDHLPDLVATMIGRPAPT